MDHIVIEGTPAYDGRYDWDALETGFNTREWGWIKRITGYLPDTLWDGWRDGDPEITLLFAVIAMRRADKIAASDVPGVFDKLSDVPPQSILRWEHDPAEPVEDDAGPPGPVEARKLELERRLFWGRFRDEFGEIGRRPETYWDARLGYFGVGPNEVGELTPAQLLGCASLFEAVYGAG